MYNKPGYAKRIRRIHHTERMIQRRAQRGWDLGYVPGNYRWRPYTECCYSERYGVHRLYHLLGLPCPCMTQHGFHRLGITSKQRNKPTNDLADQKSCGSYCPCKSCDMDEKQGDYLARFSAKEQVEEWGLGDNN